MTKEQQYFVDDVMAQVHIYACAWAGYTRTFAVGKAFDDYAAARNELRATVLAKFADLQLERQPTSQDVLDAERWRHFACNQTAMMLGSELSPFDTNVNWLEECNRMADAAIKGKK